MIISLEKLTTVPKGFFGTVLLQEEAVCFLVHKKRKAMEYTELFEFMEASYRAKNKKEQPEKHGISEEWVESDSFMDYILEEEGKDLLEKKKILSKMSPGITPLEAWVDHSVFGDQFSKAIEALRENGSAKIYDNDINNDRSLLAYNHVKDKYVYNGDMSVYYIQGEVISCDVFCSDFIDEDEYCIIHNLRSMLLSFFASALNVKRGTVTVVMSRFYQDDFNSKDIKRVSYETKD